MVTTANLNNVDPTWPRRTHEQIYDVSIQIEFEIIKSGKTRAIQTTKGILQKQGANRRAQTKSQVLQKKQDAGLLV